MSDGLEYTNELMSQLVERAEYEFLAWMTGSDLITYEDWQAGVRPDVVGANRHEGAA